MPVQCTCATCGRAYFVKPTKATTTQFCSRDCRHAADRAKPGSTIERFWARINKNGPVIRSELGPCWVWTGSKTRYGYPSLYVGMPVDAAIKGHRFAWEMVTGDVLTPEDHVCHTCDVRHCVRHDDIGTYEVGGVSYQRRGHLWLGNHDANMQDMTTKQRNGFTVHPETAVRGVASHFSKLTPDIVLAIRARSASGEQHRRLAAEFGLTPDHITNIVKRRAWSHLE